MLYRILSSADVAIDPPANADNLAHWAYGRSESIAERVLFLKRALGVGVMPAMLAIRFHRSGASSGMAVVRQQADA